MLIRDRAMHHFSITEGHLEVRTHRSAQVLQSTQEDKGGTVSASKMDEVVCAHNFFKRKGAKPILQATVTHRRHSPCLGWPLEPGAACRNQLLVLYYIIFPSSALETASPPCSSEIQHGHSPLNSQDNADSS
jgi:hypothetical protein